MDGKCDRSKEDLEKGDRLCKTSKLDIKKILGEMRFKEKDAKKGSFNSTMVCKAKSGNKKKKLSEVGELQPKLLGLKLLNASNSFNSKHHKS